jgi:hypothetical protein
MGETIDGTNIYHTPIVESWQDLQHDYMQL